MKKMFTLAASLFAFAHLSVAQIGTTATDFTVTDIDGGQHNLYSILDQGYVVILDCSATWCGPCWGYHTAGFLHDINATYGPTGSNQVRVMFYEADASTTQADLEGTGGNTQGDWITGVDYPIINETPLQLSGAKYWPLGFPTINVINPVTKEIEADLWDNWGANDAQSLADMINVIDDFFVASLDENTFSAEVKSFPNPSNGTFTLSINTNEASEMNVEITNLVGQLVYRSIETVEAGLNSINVNLPNVDAGQYIVRISNEKGNLTSSINVVK